MIYKGIMIEIHKHCAYVESENENEAKKLLEALQKQNENLWDHEEGFGSEIIGIEALETPPDSIYINSSKDLEGYYWICTNCSKRMKGGFIKGQKHYCSKVCYKVVEGKYPEFN